MTVLMNNINSLSLDSLITVWMEWALWLVTPDLFNRMVLVSSLMLILCYVALVFSKMGGDEMSPILSENER